MATAKKFFEVEAAQKKAFKEHEACVLIVAYQEINGSWGEKYMLNHVKTICPGFGLKKDPLLDLGAVQGLKNEDILTLLIVTALTTRCPDKKDIWEAAVAKAEKFLVDKISYQQREEILQVFKAFKMWNTCVFSYVALARS